MTTEGQETAISAQPNSQRANLDYRISELNRALALVRPVSMGDDMASDWLAAALGEVADLSEVDFAEGIQRARRECSYHGQIVPTILREHTERAKRVAEYGRSLDALRWPLGKRHGQANSIADDRQVAGLIETAAKALTGANR